MDGQQTGDTIEKQLAPNGGKDLSGVLDEIHKHWDAKKGKFNDDDFVKNVNSTLGDDQNKVADLDGFQLTGVDKDGAGVFTNEQGVRVRYNEKGERSEIWGDEKNDRVFFGNENGDVMHTVKPGETMWGIARDICREKHLASKDGKEPTSQEIQAEVKAIAETNKDSISDPDKIYPGKNIIVPKESVDAIKIARACNEIASKDSKDETKTSPDSKDSKDDDKTNSESNNNNTNGDTTPQPQEQNVQPQQPQVEQQPQSLSEEMSNARRIALVGY